MSATVTRTPFTVQLVTIKSKKSFKAWACIRCQKCRIDVEATRMALIVLATHLRQIPSGLHWKISTKSGDQF